MSSATYVWGDSCDRSRSRDRARDKDRRRNDSRERKKGDDAPGAPVDIDIAKEAAKAAAALRKKDPIVSERTRRLYKTPKFGASGWDNQEADPRGLVHPGYKNVPGMPKDLDDASGVVSVPRSLLVTGSGTSSNADTQPSLLPSDRPVQGFAADKAVLGIESLSTTGFVGASPGSVGEAPVGSSRSVLGSVPTLGAKPNTSRPQSFYEIPNIASLVPGCANTQGGVGDTMGGPSNIMNLPSLPGANRVPETNSFTLATMPPNAGKGKGKGMNLPSLPGADKVPETNSFTLATMPPNAGKGKGKGKWDGGKGKWGGKDGLGGTASGSQGNSWDAGKGNWGGNSWSGSNNWNAGNSWGGGTGGGNWGGSGPSQYPTLPGASSSLPPTPAGGFFQTNPALSTGSMPPPMGGGMSSLSTGGSGDQSNPNVYVELNQGLRQFGTGASSPSPSLGGTATHQALLAAQLANKQIQCKEFNVGKCEKGAACPFMHKDRVTLSAYKTKMCQFFRKGEICMNGLLCSWAHSEAELMTK